MSDLFTNYYFVEDNQYINWNETTENLYLHNSEDSIISLNSIPCLNTEDYKLLSEEYLYKVNEATQIPISTEQQTQTQTQTQNTTTRETRIKKQNRIFKISSSKIPRKYEQDNIMRNIKANWTKYIVDKSNEKVYKILGYIDASIKFRKLNSLQVTSNVNKKQNENFFQKTIKEFLNQKISLKKSGKKNVTSNDQVYVNICNILKNMEKEKTYEFISFMNMTIEDTYECFLHSREVEQFLGKREPVHSSLLRKGLQVFKTYFPTTKRKINAD